MTNERMEADHNRHRRQEIEVKASRISELLGGVAVHVHVEINNAWDRVPTGMVMVDADVLLATLENPR